MFLTGGFTAASVGESALRKAPTFGGYLKQSTAHTVRVFMSVDGFAPRVGITTFTTVQCAKDSAAFVAVSPIITERAYGWYEVDFTASHTDTLGELTLHLETASGDVEDWYWLVTVDGLEPIQTLAAITAVQADVDDLQTRIPVALVDGRMDAVVTTMDISSTVIANAVLAVARSGHINLGSIGEGIALACALLQGNIYVDNVTNTVNGQTAARLRVFHDGAMAIAATAGGVSEGEFATFAITTVYTGPNKTSEHRVVQL